MMALVNGAAEVGRRCFAGQDGTLQVALADGATQIDEFVLRNSEWTPAELERFKQEEALGDWPEEELCRGDPLTLYEYFRATGAEPLRAQIAQVLARPGPPTWGDCL